MTVCPECKTVLTYMETTKTYYCINHGFINLKNKRNR